MMLTISGFVPRHTETFETRFKSGANSNAANVSISFGTKIESDPR